MKTWKIEYLLDDSGIDKYSFEDIPVYFNQGEICNEVVSLSLSAGLTIRELKVEEVE